MTTAVPRQVALYLVAVNFFFALTWTVYVLYLPQLAAKVGIPKSSVIYILLLDQLIFASMDLAMGLAADRVARTAGRLGYAVLSVTLVSCVAFLLLPIAAPTGSAWLFIGLIVLWTATSSVLRAPPLMLLGKYAAKSAVPWLSAMTLLGMGVAAALSPYLTVVLRDLDPRIPFALSSIALALATVGVVWIEKALVAHAASPEAKAAKVAEAAIEQPRQANPPLFWFLCGVALLALGYQVHGALNSAPLYLRFAKPADLEHLMPIFWIGFNLAVLPASFATKRYGGLAVMGGGAVLGAVASFFAAQAGSLNGLIAMQLLAGVAWGCVLSSAVAAALAIGNTGREGEVVGMLFTMLALATFARMAVVAAQLNTDPQFVAVRSSLPVLLWVLAGIGLLALVWAQARRPTLQQSTA